MNLLPLRRIRSLPMIAIVTVGILLVTAVITNASVSSAADPARDRMADRVDRIAGDYFDSNLVAGFSIAVSRKQEVVFAKGYGFSDLARRTKANTDTVYRTGSVGKQFTAAALVRLAQEGKLSLDDDVATLLPAYPQFKGIVVRQLLDHTAGLREINGIPVFARTQGIGMTSKQAIDLISAQPREFAPGDEWSYSNSGYIVAGAIIEKISGRAADEHMIRSVLRPIGMRHTSDCRPGEEKAAGYDQQEAGGWSRALRLGRQPGLTPAKAINLEIVASAGGFCSTPRELVLWTDKLHSGSIVDPTWLSQMTTPTKLRNGRSVPYGLGLQRRRFGSHEGISHSGIIWGFNAVVAHFPDDDLSVALMVNTLLPEQDGVRLWTRVLGAVFGEASHPWDESGYGGA